MFFWNLNRRECLRRQRKGRVECDLQYKPAGGAVEGDDDYGHVDREASLVACGDARDRKLEVVVLEILLGVADDR